MEDSDKIDYLAENSEYDRENLEAWDGTDCLSRLYDTVANDTNMSNENDNEDNPEEVVLTESELDDKIQSRAEEIVANREEQNEKEELATEIVANSNEYEDTETVLEDFPTVASLKTKQDSVTDSGGLPNSGLTPNADMGDDDIDVSSGVFE